MLVSEVFTRLSFGELSNLSISGEGSGTIIMDKQPKIVSYINDGLVKLYGRFVLKLNDLMLNPLENLTFYELSSKFAETRAAEFPDNIHYIHDTVYKPFQDDILRILEVFDINGCKIALNDVDDRFSVFTPQTTVLQVPYPIKDRPISVMYQCRHPQVLNEPDAIIDLPLSLEKALLAYVASQVFTHMNGQEHTAKAAEHLATYEMICIENEEKDLVNSSQVATNTKFFKRGFV